MAANPEQKDIATAKTINVDFFILPECLCQDKIGFLEGPSPFAYYYAAPMGLQLFYAARYYYVAPTGLNMLTSLGLTPKG